MEASVEEREGRRSQYREDKDGGVSRGKRRMEESVQGRQGRRHQ